MKLLLVLCLVCAPALAAVDWEAAIVKTTSRLCAGGTPYVGSGTVFRQDGKAYIVTSDHTQLHLSPNRNDLKDYCETASGPTLPEHSFTFLTAESGYGLSLLRLDDVTPEAPWPTIADFAGATIARGDAVTVGGFPATSNSLITDPGGRVLDPASAQALFPLLPGLIDVGGAQGEFGMSGGPAWRADGSFAGVLTHQIVQGLNNELRLIPARYVHDWLTEYFAGPDRYLPYFWQEADQASTESYWTYDLIVSKHCGFEVDPLECHVHFNSMILERARLFDDPAGVMKRMAKYLDPQAPHNLWGEVWAFRHGHAPTREPLQRVTVPMEFFSRLKDPDWEPCLVTKTSEAWVEDLAPAGRHLGAALDRFGAGTGADEQKWVETARIVAELLATAPSQNTYKDIRWMMVQLKDVEALEKSAPAELRAALAEVHKYLAVVTIP